MRKLVLALVAVLSFNFTSCGAFNTDKQGVAETVEVNTVHSTQLRGVWLSYFEIAEMCKGKTEEVYTGNVEEVVKNTAEAGLNTIFYQVRCFGDALYNSSVFPTSKYIVQNEGDAIEYDPFRIFIDIAKKYSISVHAWVNPFRVSYSEDFTLLSENNPARIFSEEGNSENQLLVCEKGIYYNPASEESRTLLYPG
ncbi:MAG: family 10 glycosylhydrolase [Clostridia bacterium]|nr:family 10 glycosylhydrolase [Clostridia bacterium]